MHASPGLGLPTSPRPLGHVDQPAKPRGPHARLDADHLEVLEGPNRPSADFFHTRSSTAASPRACVSNSTCASSCSSRVDGPDRPAANAVFPASRKSALHRPINCSLTFSRRTASAIAISPANTLSTIQVSRSAGITGGLPLFRLSSKTYTTALPQNLTRNNHNHAPAVTTVIEGKDACVRGSR